MRDPSDAHAGTRTPPAPGAFQTNLPAQPEYTARAAPKGTTRAPECTVASNGQQRPPKVRARAARIWPGVFSALAHSPHH
jgi:hypothetical protein